MAPRPPVGFLAAGSKSPRSRDPPAAEKTNPGPASVASVSCLWARTARRCIFPNALFSFLAFTGLFSFGVLSLNIMPWIRELESSAKPELESSAKPRHPRKRAAICAVIKDEEAYLDEFVDYYFGLGFYQIFLYDNSELNEMRQWGLKWGDPGGASNRVKIIHYPGVAMQQKAYLDCASMLTTEGNSFEYVAFFDIDEFLVLKKHDNVDDFLKEHLASGAVGINWFFFRGNSEVTYLPLPVTKRFLYREEKVNQHIKSIVRLQDMDLLRHPGVHNVFLRNGTQHDTRGKVFTGPFNPDGPTDVAVLHHYHTKSLKEYILKSSRGRADINNTKQRESGRVAAKQKMENFLQRNNLNVSSGVFDDSSWKLLKKNVPKYAAFDNF